MLIPSPTCKLPARRAAACLALVGVLLHMAACASSTPAPSSTTGLSATLPSTDGTGLQIITWTIDNASTLALPTASDAAAVAPRMQEAWQTANMVVARVRTSEIDAIARSIALTTPPQQQLLAFSPLRSEAMRGDPTAYDLLRLESGTMPLRNAAARMLIRGWPVPNLPAQTDTNTPPAPLRAAVHVELVPQVLSLTRPRRTGLEPIDNSPESQGVVLSRLVLETTLLDGEALIIYPAQAPTPSQTARMRTQAENANVPAPSSRPARESTASSELPTATPPDTLVVEAEEAGPAIPTTENLPTFGDALLTDALALPTQGTRRVLIIVPKPPATYSLLRPK